MKEQQQTEMAIEDKRGRKGRKSSDGTPETIKFEPIKKACKEMMKAFKKAEAAKDEYDACVAGVAERSNSNVTTLKKLIKASAKGKFTDVRNKIYQESVIFETVGEVSAAGAVTGE